MIGSAWPAWMAVAGDAVILSVHAQPGAKVSAFAGEHGDALKVRIAAPPVDGKANQALAEFLAKALGVPLRQVSLLSGDTARRKRFRIDGVAPRQVIDALSS